MTMIKKGMRVVLNNKYIEYEEHKGEVFTVTSEPFKIASGDVIVLLDHHFKGGYAADGLEASNG